MLDYYAFEVAGIGVAGLAIMILAGVRIYYGPRFNDIPWAVVRPVVVPIAHELAKRKLGDEFYTVYDVDREEHVITLELPYQDVVDDLEAADYVVEPLAAYKTDWNGNREVASYARHLGPKPFPGAPSWLKEYQVHVTLFETPSGGTTVTAHHEFNSWRWDRAEAHYRGEGLDVAKGVQLAAEDLGVEAALV